MALLYLACAFDKSHLILRYENLHLVTYCIFFVILDRRNKSDRSFRHPKKQTIENGHTPSMQWW